MPRLKTIEENLLKRLSDSISDVTSPTSFSINLEKFSRRIPSFEDIMGATDVTEPEDDSNMLQGLGKALWVGGAHFAEMSTFGAGKLFGIHAPEPETTGQKVGAAIGGAAGFLIPFGAGKAAVSYGARLLAGKEGSRYVAKRVYKQVNKKLGDLGDDAVKYSGSLDKVDDPTKLFMDEIFKPTVVAPIKGFASAFKNINKRNDFVEMVGNNAGRTMRELGELRGFQLSDDAVKAITNSVKKEWDNIGARPITDLQSLLAKKFGDGKGANFYGHLFEEGVVFAAVENLMHGIDVAAGETDADFLGTTAHAIMLGHALGIVRFVPGGVRRGTLGFFNKPGRERMSMLIKSTPTYAKSYNTGTAEGRGAIRRQYKIFSRMSDAPTIGKDGLSVRRMMSKVAEKSSHNKPGVVKGGDYSFTNLNKILETGTEEQKKAVAEMMRDGLINVGSHLRREWKGDFLKVWASDLGRSLPRMGIGGLVMGNMALFDENIPFEDKLITFATGAFLMKHGKEVTYRTGNAKNSKWEMRESLTEFPERLTEIQNMYQALGVDNMNQLWFNLVAKAKFDQEYPNITAGMKESPDEIKRILDIAHHKHPESPKEMFVTEIVKDKDGNITFKKSKKKGETPSGEIEQLYNDFIQLTSKESILAEGTRYKEWEELHPKEKMKFKELLEENKIQDRYEIFDMFVEANTARFVQTYGDGVQSAVDAASSILGAVPIAVEKSNGQKIYTFKVINGSNAALTAKEQTALMEYSALIRLLADNGMAKIAPGEPVMLKTGEKGLGEFSDIINNSVERLNQNLGFEGERGVKWSSQWLDTGAQFLTLRQGIQAARKEIPDLLDKTNQSEIGILAKKIFHDKYEGGLLIVDEVSVKGSKSLTNALNSILKVARLLGNSGDSRDQKGKVVNKVTQKEAKQLIEWFEDRNITGFSSELYKQRNSFADNVRHYVMRDRLEGAYKRIYDKDGKVIGVQTLDATDIAIMQRLVDSGIQNDGFSIKPIQNIMFDMESRGLFNAETPFTEPQIVEMLKTEGRSPGEIQTYINLYKELSKDGQTKGRQLITALNNLLRPYMKGQETVDGKVVDVGILIQSPRQKVSIDVAALHNLVTELSYIATGKLPAKAQRFLKRMNEDLMQSESETKLMLGHLLKSLAVNNRDAIKVYTLAVEYGLWNPVKQDFTKFPDTVLQQKLKAILQVTQREWGIEKDSINELQRTIEKIDRDSAGRNDERTITMSQFLNKYQPIGEFGDNPIGENQGRTHSEQLQKLFYSDKYDFGKKHDQFMIDLYDNIVSNVTAPVKNQAQLRNDMIKLTVDAESTRRVRKIKFNQAVDSQSTWVDGVVKESAMMKHVYEAIGSKNIGGSVDGIVIIESEGMGRNGSLRNLTDTSYYESAREKLFHGEYSAVYSTFEGVKIDRDLGVRGTAGREKSYVMFRVGASEWAYGIEITPGSLTVNNIKTNYLKYIERAVIDFGLKQSDANKILKDLGFEKIIGKDGKTEGWDLNIKASAKEATKQIHQIMNDLTIGKMMGRRWWKEKIRDSVDADMAGLSKRLKLTNNISANNLSTPLIKSITRFMMNSDGDLDVVKKLNQFADGKINEVTIRDEVGKNIPDAFSIKRALREEYQTLIDNKKLDQEIIKGLEDSLRKLEDTSDASSVNSVTIVEPGMFKALAQLFGQSDSENMGGIKPIILKFDGNNQFIINKTAFVKNKKVQRIFDNNPDLGFVTFTSASKKINNRYSDGYEVLDVADISDASRTIGSKYKRSILPEDVKLLSVKGDKSEASIPPNHTAHIQRADALNSFFNYYIAPKIESAESRIESLKNPDNHHSIVAEFRHQVSKAVGETDPDVGYQSKQLGIEEIFANNYGMPHIFERAWENRIKRQYIDNLIRLKTGGGQGVLSPDIGIEVEAVGLAKGTFKTAKGSTYIVQTDGTTVRDKASRPEHPGDSGVKKQSSRTVYLNPRTVKQLFGPFGNLATVVFNKATGTETTGIQSLKFGELGLNIQGKTYGVSNSPKKGHQPFEVWLDDGGDIVSYHVGNKITEIGTSEIKPVVRVAAKLKNTIIAGSDIFQYGEIEIGSLNRDKPIDYGNVRLIKRYTDKADVEIDLKSAGVPRKGIRTLGQLHDWAVKKGLQVAIVAERNPHTKPDSILLLGLKGFRASEEGNVTVINDGDVKRALEGDFDIDTVNFWWNSPETLFNAYKKGRGTIQDSKVAQGADSDMSWSGLRLNDPDDMRLYSERLRKSDYLKGTIMNAQRIVQWLSHYNSTFEAHNEGALIRIGQNRYARAKKGEKLDNVYQNIANLNQEILDAENGYNINKIRDFDSIMRDILFHPDHGLFEVRHFSSERVARGKEGFHSIGDNVVREHEQQVIFNLIRPYRDLMSLANKVYDNTGQGRKVGLRELVQGVREYDYSISNAQRTARNNLSKSELELIGDKPIYNGFDINAKILGGSRDPNTLLPYDRILARIADIGDMGLDFSNTTRQSNPYAHEIFTLTELSAQGKSLKDAIDTIVGKNQSGFTKINDIANAIDSQIESLGLLAKSFSNDSQLINTSGDISRRIEEMRNAKNDILKSVSDKIKNDDSKVFKRLRENVIAEHQKRIMRGEKDISAEDALKEAKKRVEKDGVLVEAIKKSDVLSALASSEAFGNIAYRSAKELGVSETAYSEMNKEVSNLKKEYELAWDKFFNPKNQEWTNESEIYEVFMGRLDKIVLDHASNNVNMVNIMLSRLMVPDTNLAKFGAFQGNLYPMPKHRNHQKYINLGLRWNQIRRGERPDGRMFNGYVADAYSRQLLRFGGKDTALYTSTAQRPLGMSDVESSFFTDPLEFSKGHQRRAFLAAVAENAYTIYGKKFSMLDKYEKLNSIWGMGLIRDIVSHESSMMIPEYGVTGNRWYQLNGNIYNLQGSIDRGAKVWITGQKDVISEMTKMDREDILGVNQSDLGRSFLQNMETRRRKAANESC